MPAEPHGPLLKVCSLLNAESAEYIVVGAWALILNNIIRATEDVDILIAENAENYLKVIRALSRLEDGAAAELKPEDFEKNMVVKIADEVEVDVSRRAWSVTFGKRRRTHSGLRSMESKSLTFRLPT